MLQTFDRQYELPKKTYISQTAIPALYNTVKDDILNELKDVSFYSATTDMWSSSNMTPYELNYPLHNCWLDSAIKMFRDQIYTPEPYCCGTCRSPSVCFSIGWGQNGLYYDRQWYQHCGCNTQSWLAMAQLLWPQPPFCCFPWFGQWQGSSRIPTKPHGFVGILNLNLNLANTFNLSWLKKRDLRKAQSEANLPQHSLVLVSNE